MSEQLIDPICNIEPGGHLCLFYEKEPAEQIPILMPFIQQGLCRGEQFIYIADNITVQALAAHLSRNGIDVPKESATGRLVMQTGTEWSHPGDPDTNQKAHQVRRLIAQAKNAGFKGLRFAVEMTSTLGPDFNARQIQHWEATMNTLFEPSFPCRMICQYNRTGVHAEALIAALHTHSEAVIGDIIYPNPFYQAPLIPNPNGHSNALADNKSNQSHLNDRTPLTRLNWMISQLQQAREAEEKRIETEARSQATKPLNRQPLEQSTPQDAFRFFAAIVEFSDDAIITKDLTGIITSWNPGATRLFGYAPEEVIGKPISILIPPEREDEEPNILARLQQGQRIDHYETVRRRKDGTLLHISLTVSPVRNSEGRIVGASKIARDITERKRAEEELRQTRQQLIVTNQNLEERVLQRTASLQAAIAQMEEFSYSVSHDLRAPVRVMKGYAEAVIEDYGDRLDAKGRDYLERIVRGSSRMERLIHDVLTYSRLGRGDFHLQPVLLQKLIPEIVQQYPGMQPPNAEISIRDPLLPVIGHEPSLTQAISNLLSNGVKFVARGTVPRLQIWTEPRNTNVRLWIEDNGIGIKAEYQRRLFSMFERVHQDKSYDGTGIGLAVVRKAVERMGGTVGIQSDGITGSSFWIELPALPQPTNEH